MSREFSLSLSVQMMHNAYAMKQPVELFADHAEKAYERENERHWTRIEKRLEKVGLSALLSHMGQLVVDSPKSKGKKGKKAKEKKKDLEDEKSKHALDEK